MGELDDSIEKPVAGDFRFKRYKLPPEYFLVHPEQEPEPTDLIDPETWGKIITLPDDVSLRTSEHHGTLFKNANQFVSKWIELCFDVDKLAVAPNDDALALSCLDAYDDFRASIYAAITGYYRQSMSALRYALEEILVGAYFRANPDPVKMREWIEGNETAGLSVGKMMKNLREKAPYSQFETGDDTLFSADGWVEFVYKYLSAYSHGRPHYMSSEGIQISTSCAGLWGGSNGPVYEDESVIRWSKFFSETALLCLMLVGLAEDRLLTEHPQSDRYYVFLVDTVTWHPHYSHPGLFPIVRKIIKYLCEP